MEVRSVERERPCDAWINHTERLRTPFHVFFPDMTISTL